MSRWASKRVAGPLAATGFILLWLILRPGLAHAQSQPLGTIPPLEQQIESVFTLGKYDEAEALARQYIERATSEFGRDSAEAASGYGWLGLVQWSTGHFDSAEPLLREALEIDQRRLGPTHPNVARDLGSYGNFLQERGRFTDAEPLIRQALAIDQQNFGPNDPKVATDSNNLGLMLREQGRFAEAEPLLLRALAITETVKGRDDPAVNIRLRNLAALYRDLGRYGDAEPLLKRAIDVAIKSKGDTSADVASGRAILGRLYRDTRKYGDAEAEHELALKIRESVFGADNVRTAVSLADLAALYGDLGRLQLAAEFMQRAISIREKALGDDHPIVGFSICQLAGIKEHQGSTREAEQLYRKALAIQESKLSATHPDLATTRANLGGLLKSQQRLTEALPLLERALAMREASLPGDHPAIAANLLQLSELYRMIGRLDDADRMFRRALTMRKAAIKELPIYFATDRKIDPAAKDLAFGTERDLTHVSVGVARVGVLGNTNSSRLVPRSVSSRPPESEENTDVSRISIQALSKFSSDVDLFTEAEKRLKSSEAYPGQVMVFVHGYNVSFENAVRRAGQIAFDLNFDGPTIVFSWPSRQSILGYITDRDTVDIAAQHLRQFLLGLAKDTSVKKLQLVAHSMGNMVLLRAISGIATEGDKALPIGVVVDAAPDVDPELFEHFSQKLRAGGGSVTVYASALDRALWVSGLLRGRYPIGYIGSDGRPSMVAGVDIIDITAAGTSWFALNHDVYASSPVIVADMQRVFAGEHPPDRRTKELMPVHSAAGTYWLYRNPRAETAP